MNFQDKTYEHIEDFLNGRLNPSEQEAFALQIELNPDLAQQVEAHQLANELVLEHKLLDVKTILNEEIRKTERWKNIRKAIAIGAGIVAAVMLITFLSVKKNEVTESGSSIAPENKTKTLAAGSQKKTESIEQDKRQPASSPEQVIHQAKSSPVESVSDQTVEEEKAPVISDTVAIDQEVKVDPVVASADTMAKADQENKQKTDSAPADPCATAIISAKISTEAACEQEKNGRINLRITGGNSPYSSNIINKEGEIVSGNNLPAGIYKIAIQDAKGCTKTYPEVIITEKACVKEYSFNPFIGEVFEIPAYSQEGVFEVYDNTGKLLLSKILTSGSNDTWDGSSMTGEVTTGYFMFRIKYSDNKQKQGYITIVR